MTPGANPPVVAIARAVVALNPCSASVCTVARSTRSRVCVLGGMTGSDHPPRHNAGPGQERIEPPGKARQVVAGHLRVQVVLQVVGQLQEDRWDDPAAEGTGL